MSGAALVDANGKVVGIYTEGTDRDFLQKEDEFVHQAKAGWAYPVHLIAKVCP
jgi:hypothetical protein